MTKKMRTALVRTAQNASAVMRYDDYESQKDFAQDLRGNGYKVVKIWHGNISDAEVEEWDSLHHHTREEMKAILTKAEANVEDYAVSTNAQDIAIAAEIALANVETEVTANADDDFNAALAALKSDFDRKQAITAERHADFGRVQEAYNRAVEDEHAAENALKIFGKAKSQELRETLITDDLRRAKGLTVTDTDGRTCEPDFTNIYIGFYYGDAKFYIQASAKADRVTLAEFDTPAEVTTAITALKSAIARDDKYFDFRNIEPASTEPESPGDLRNVGSTEQVIGGDVNVVEYREDNIQPRLHRPQLVAANAAFGGTNSLGELLLGEPLLSSNLSEACTKVEHKNPSASDLRHISATGKVIERNVEEISKIDEDIKVRFATLPFVILDAGFA